MDPSSRTMDPSGTMDPSRPMDPNELTTDNVSAMLVEVVTVLLIIGVMPYRPCAIGATLSATMAELVQIVSKVKVK